MCLGLLICVTIFCQEKTRFRERKLQLYVVCYIKKKWMGTKFYQVHFSASFREHTIFPFFNLLMGWHTLILPALYFSTWWPYIYSLDSIRCLYLVSFTSISVREIGLSFSIILIPLSHTSKKIIPPQEWAGKGSFFLS